MSDQTFLCGGRGNRASLSATIGSAVMATPSDATASATAFAMAAGADGAALAHALDPAGHRRRRRLEVTDLERGHVAGRGKRVVHQGAGHELAGLVVHDPLE